MNIWILNHYAVTPLEGGGTRHFDLARELVKQNHQVSIFASSFSHATREERQRPDGQVGDEVYQGVKFVWIKTVPYFKNNWRRLQNMLSYSFNAYKQGTARAEQPDVIIGTLMHPLAALTGYFLAKKKGSLFYFEERDLWPQTLIDLGKVSPRHPVVWLLGSLELFLYTKARRIIVLFDKAPDYVAQRGIAREKVLYLPNGVDFSRYDQSTKELPPQLEEVFQQHQFVAIYTGAHGLANNLDPILDAAHLLNAKNKDVHFLFVGEGTEKERLMARQRAEGIANITFAPPVAKELIPAVLAKATVGLIAMHDARVYRWGISLNKMYDYMASGLPILLLASLEQTVIEGSGSGLKVATAAELAQELDRLAGQPEEVEAMGSLAQEYVRKNHSWEILSKKVLDVLEADVQEAKNGLDGCLPKTRG